VASILFVSTLKLIDFRNYVDVSLTFKPGVNIILGSNGQGKTNIVEAINYLSTMSSHRVYNDKPLIHKAAQYAIIRAIFSNAGREIFIDFQINERGANRGQINGSVVPIKEFSRNIKTVLFAPEDINIVRGEPATRRRFIDHLVLQAVPRMTAVFLDYERTLKQRNTLLKSLRYTKKSLTNTGTLAAWSERLITFGTEIIMEREKLISALEPIINDVYLAIAGKNKKVSLVNEKAIFSQSKLEDTYSFSASHSREEIFDYFTKALNNSLPLEMERGITLVGPHRDDLLLKLGDLPARGYASHGESWSLALSLRLAAANFLRASSALGDPIIILDDVFAELDEKRRNSLAEAVHGYDQVLITAAVREDVPDLLAVQTINIHDGKVVDSDE